MKNLTVIICTVVFGGFFSFLMASFDAAYSISATVSEIGTSSLGKQTFQRDELEAMVFYFVQIFGGCVFGLLAAIGALSLGEQKPVLSMVFITLGGILRGAVNFFEAYNYQIAMLNAGDTHNLAIAWRNTIILTLIFFTVGIAVCWFAVWLVKTVKRV